MNTISVRKPGRPCVRGRGRYSISLSTGALDKAKRLADAENRSLANFLERLLASQP